MCLISGKTKNVKTGIVHAAHGNKKPLCYSFDQTVNRAKDLLYDDRDINGVTCKRCLSMDDVRISYSFVKMHREVLNECL